jgi:hypothetical protein
LGADFASLFFGRLVFAVLASALIAGTISLVSDAVFFKAFFHNDRRKSARMTSPSAG